MFDSKTGKISDNYYRSLPRRPLLRCNMTTARSNGGRDTAVKSIAVAVSEREFCLQYDELDHGVEWWQPETSRAEEKLRRGLRISQSKGGQLTVALKTSGSVAFARAVPKTPIFSPNGTSKLKRSTRSSEGERRSLPSFIYPNASPGNTKNDSSFAREDYPKPLSAATGDSRYSHGSQLFVLHEQLLQSLVPSSCCSDKFSRLVSFAVHMTQVVLDELNKGLGANGKITEEIVSAVARRNIEHAIAMLLHPPAATTGLD